MATTPLPEPVPLPALHASHSGCWLSDAAGNVRGMSRGEAIMAAAETPLLMLNAPLVASRLGYPELSGLDLLELFAFVHPARFMVPTPKGLAEALNLPLPEHEGEVPGLLARAAARLFEHCEAADWAEREGAHGVLQALARLKWPWSGLLAPHVARPERAERWLFARLPEWEEKPPRPQPAHVVLEPDAVGTQLDALTGADAERREGQHAYARDAAHVFAPRPEKGRPNVVLAEAGTGVGKTLGYLAPASLWSRAAGGTVWVSTYTKALQRQLRRESRRAWGPDDDRETPSVVVRKGRENYLCLLNLEDALQGGFQNRAGIFAQLVARWAAYSEDGDMVGGDLPGWLPTLFRRRGLAALTDRRGECVYAACPHYRKCFIERAARQSAHADLVIANHALVMVHAARGGEREGQQRPSRVIFDEGHHLFDAADSTFAVALSGSEAIEMRRWVIGPEGKSKGRRRGLAARLADVASYDEDGERAIAAAREAASALPSDGWLARIAESQPWGPFESLFAAVRRLTHARDEAGSEAGYGLETEAVDLDGAFLDAATQARDALASLRQPLMKLAARLEAILTDPPDWLDPQGRQRIEGARHSLSWRIDTLTAWEALLARLGGPADPDFVDWLAVDRAEAREFDIAIHRRWLDPMRPFAATVLEPAHGVLQTSATLCDRTPDGHDWDRAVRRSGAAALGLNPRMTEAESPFDYARQAQVIIVTDVKKGDIAGLAAAYGRLIEASKGGVLGLFTAIRRLRAVHARIADRLARNGLPLFAQHVDPIDTGTLVDIFRDDPRASLLGTDALRDGVDVPGDSLRLVIMEQVPWPKPSILHRARRAASGGGREERQAHDDAIVRARLAQAFGRLIRSRDDTGAFVVLSAAFPSRLLSAFPPGTPVTRTTLDDALQILQPGVSLGKAAATEQEI
ncbi:ATP-dependent DNA helicase [Croceicoccus naphthovorans]|uniref:Helicase n=1 Tax=Croceicoccus naphthovorans TaxID=1348774 RepID=A0A0G3XIF8_9SPHN|nr:ATP-dependent DNA helicase [Croceicoccus naphthovorans]AKM10118.1 helicase [Croceicoccus naphthovorans]MBB3991595.1 ATP-dependent DNA helicase DinG [Croceicoccus naphthovorans]